MPQRIVCDRCNYVLYEGNELKSPSEVIDRHGGLCPNCGSQLKVDLGKILILASEGRTLE